MIFIPFEVFTKGVGGPSTFMRNLKEYLLSQQYPFIEDINKISQSDSIFFPISFNERVLKYFKKNKKPIIQRLDGVYYPSKHGFKYHYLNREIKKDYFKYSDFVIFQSKFSRLECFTIMGEIPDSKYAIILNGTDKKVFKPSFKRFSKNNIIFGATGSFRNKDMILPVVKALDDLSKDYKIEYRIIGPVTNNEVLNILKRPYITLLGEKDKYGLGEELKKIDILIHCQLNPACPNSVIEAISCGIPVVGFDTGAMREVMYFAPELLAYVSDDIFQLDKDFNDERLLEKLKLCIEKFDYYKEIFLKNSNLYDFNNTAKEYIKVFESVLRG